VAWTWTMGIHVAIAFPVVPLFTAAAVDPAVVHIVYYTRIRKTKT
jgi:hypothetical protein